MLPQGVWLLLMGHWRPFRSTAQLFGLQIPSSRKGRRLGQDHTQHLTKAQTFQSVPSAPYPVHQSKFNSFLSPLPLSPFYLSEGGRVLSLSSSFLPQSSRGLIRIIKLGSPTLPYLGRQVKETWTFELRIFQLWHQWYSEHCALQDVQKHPAPSTPQVVATKNSSEIAK